MVIPVEELPLEPDRVAIGNLADLHTVVAESEDVDPADLHLATYWARPGPAKPTPDDGAWCSAIVSIVRGRDDLDCSLHIHDGRTALPLLPRRTWPTP
ncbi:hypothetical protein [Modestobacter sp. VKM Ac-2978]|uniref:hypothetical protein n=1 Tax=Modestobacter sp. VKM Ac-2978 TaxID=3004132 RepID=UPI0022AA88DC|nr:hypothetical protein [Modestobacter sp. VKM Ac-2978]MCZ2849126.1 hypothetical protein [Modestobacter sp. VKM Ac-2978]